MARKTQARCTTARAEEPQATALTTVVRNRTAAFLVLLSAHVDAQQSGQSAQEFAVELSDLRAAGIPMSELRWLISMEYVDHLLEVTPARSSKRRFTAFKSLALKGNSCFMLTERGLADALDCYTRNQPTSLINGNPAATPVESSMPRWDAGTRKLWLGNSLVRQFMTQAYNQVHILAAFEEEGWPEHLDDPLPPNGSRERKRKLHDAINKLNRHQLHPLIQFRGDGTGRGVCWQLVKATPE